jgi:hypothetical protein
MILLLNGAFGVGKTTVARAVVARLPRAVLFDPEIIGIALQRLARAAGRHVDDFQDLPLWRRLTIVALRVTRLFWPNIVVPMAFSDLSHLREIRSGIARFEPRALHFCLVAPLEVIHDRLRQRGSSGEDAAWQYRRAAECCTAHESSEFATHIRAEGRTVDEIAEEIVRAVAHHQ